MSEPFIGEIRMVGFNFAPAGWALCNGQLLVISQNPVLFSLLGTTYGGDGISTFALPNLQSRVPVHAGQGPGLSPCFLGETDGVETVTLTTSQIPAHSHGLAASDRVQSTNRPDAAVPSRGGYYDTGVPNATMSAQAIEPTGGGLPHENRQPFLVLNFIIALLGVYPTRT